MSATDKKKAAPKPADHPKYIDMITAAIADLKERNGSSRQAILKFIKANFKVGDSPEVHVKLALKRGVASGALTQPKGTGASGSFKNAKKQVEPKKPKKPTKPKPAKKTAAKPKKNTPKKKTAAKKPAAKKAAKKSPKKAKKPAAKKPAKKTTKPAAKKPAKKTPKKKPTKKPAAAKK